MSDQVSTDRAAGNDLRRLTAAIDQLGTSCRGRSALAQLLRWLEDDGLGLDQFNQDAVFVLLKAIWGRWPATARDMIQDVLSRTPDP